MQVNGYMKKKWLLIVIISICLNISYVVVVVNVVQKNILEQQFCLSMQLASEYFEEYSISKDNSMFSKGVDVIGLSAMLPPQFSEDTRIFKERIMFFQLHEGLVTIEETEKKQIIPQLIEVCKIFENDPNDLIGYVLLQEIVVVIRYD